MSEIKQKLMGEVAARQMAQEIKEGYSPIGHGHTAEEIGADASGSAAAALALANENTQTKIDELSGAVDGKLSEKANRVHAHDTDEINYNGKSLTNFSGTVLNDIILEIDEKTEVYDTNVSALTSHTGNTTVHVTQAEKDAWNAKVDTSALADKSDKVHSHNDTYYTETEIDSRFSTVDSSILNINTSITNITNGTTKVGKATTADSATSASSATKATQDGNGKVISSTYETKTDANSKLAESKEYTDTSIDALNTGFEVVIYHMYGNDLAETNPPTIREIANDEADKIQSNLDEHISDEDVHFTTNERTKLAGIATGAQKNTITGVKGNAESSYRTGNVNITPANIGLGNVDDTSDADKPVSTAQRAAIDTALEEANNYTNEKTVNLASTTVVDNKVSSHDTSTSAHNDIRLLINGLTTRLNALADSDDTTLDQMSEVVAYIKANKYLIDSVTTSKVNVSDIVNNLTTNVTNKPLSAAQGVAIQSLIDNLQSELDSHGHEIADVSGLQTALNGKAASSHGTHVAYSSITPVMDGTASVGSASTVARSDHKHPTDISRASQTDLDALEEIIANRTDWFRSGTSIPSGSDLDTYKTAGKYFASSESIAQTLLNCPTTTNFVMYVLVRTSGNSLNQLIIALNGKMYVRGSNSSGTWRDWQAYATQTDIDKTITGLSVSGKTITYTKGDDSTGTIVTQDTVYTHPTYTARTGKPTANQTPGFGGTATVSQITSDATGHVTAATDRTITIPSTLSNGTGTAGLIKTSSTVTSNSGYTACPVISGVPYYKDTDTNTTYSAGTGISLSGTTFSNSGVRSIATGSTNGTISVNTNGTASNVAVKGLGSAAYTASTAYATASHTHSTLNNSNNGSVALSYEDSDTTKNFFKPWNPVSGHTYSLGSKNYPWNAMYLSNNNSIYCLDTDGNARNIAILNDDNTLRFGYGSYEKKEGITSVFGGEQVYLAVPNLTGSSAYVGVRVKSTSSSSSYPAFFYPTTDGKIPCGSTDYRWYKLYATSSTITTSDEREKSDIMAIEDYPVVFSRDGSGNVFEKLFNKLAPKTYTLDIEDSNEVHIGFIAQDVSSSMEELGLSESDLGLLNHEYWADEETGEEKDRYGLAYEEFIALNTYMIQKQQTKIEEQQVQIATLEEHIAQLEELINSK